MRRSKVVDILSTPDRGVPVRAMGWIRTKRDSKGGFSFIELNDGSCLNNLQVIADDSLANYRSEVLKLLTGCSIQVSGKLEESPGRGQKVELKAEEIKVLGWVEPDTYPLQKKRHTFEFLRTISHLRPRTNTFGALARVRNAMSLAIHSFFQYALSPLISMLSRPAARSRS